MTDFDTVQRYLQAVKVARGVGMVLDLSYTCFTFHVHTAPRMVGDAPVFSSDSIEAVHAFLQEKSEESKVHEKKKYWYND